MDKKAIAKSLLEGKTCMNCIYMSTVLRMKTTHKKKQCNYKSHPTYKVKPLPNVLTCENYKSSESIWAKITK